MQFIFELLLFLNYVKCLLIFSSHLIEVQIVHKINESFHLYKIKSLPTFKIILHQMNTILIIILGIIITFQL